MNWYCRYEYRTYFPVAESDEPNLSRDDLMRAFAPEIEMTCNADVLVTMDTSLYSSRSRILVR